MPLKGFLLAGLTLLGVAAVAIAGLVWILRHI